MSRDREQTCVVLAHAKVNLLLRILSREASGYHGIETLFQKLALHDVVRVRVTESMRTLECAGPSMPLDGLGTMESNLAWRAAVAYADASGWQTGWEIAIEKHIPVGGGLGGGSADASAVLRALESMSPTPIGAAALLEVGGSLGADVAFFVSEASRALAWGRGDRMLTLTALSPMPVVLFAFNTGVNTAAAYGAFARARDSQAADASRGTALAAAPARVYAADAFASWSSVCALAANDFENVVPAMHIGVRAVLPYLKRVAASSVSPMIGMLSGSGATCFLLGDIASDEVALDDELVADAGARRIVTATA